MSTVRDTNFVPEWVDLEPDFPEPRIGWIENKRLDIPYGDAALQQLDLYYPAQKKETYPLVILVHGGAFMACDKRDLHLYPGFFALQAGFALASVNYRLAPANPFPAAVDDLRNAILYLRGNAAALSLDPGNFFLYGTSAGGNLVSFTGLRGHTSSGRPQDYHVNAVAALCPLINFSDFWVDGRKELPGMREMVHGYLGGEPLKGSPTDAANADAFIGNSSPAFYLQHGTQDFLGHSQSTDFYSKLREAGLPDDDLVLDIMEGAVHAGQGPEYLEAEHIQPILDFFAAHINNKDYSNVIKE